MNSTTTSDADTLDIPVDGTVLTIEFSPFDWCDSLLAVGTESRVYLFSVSLNDDMSQAPCRTLRTYSHGCPVTSITWHPHTSLKEEPNAYKFGTGGGDSSIRLFNTKTSPNDTEQQEDQLQLKGHTGPVHCLSFEPEHGQILASVSEDCTCRLWRPQDGESIACWRLGGPAVSVGWIGNTKTLAVALREGRVRIYDTETGTPLKTLYCGGTMKQPSLTGAQLTLDGVFVGATAGGHWFIWDITRGCLPVNTGGSSGQSLSKFRWFPNNQTHAAVISSPGTHVRVYNVRTGQAVASTDKLSNGANDLSWNRFQPVVAVGCNDLVRLIRVGVHS